MGGVISPVKAVISGAASGLKSSTASAATTTAPTTAEVSQATATDMDSKGIRRRRRGRSPTILTGASGVSENATLGSPTLLG